MKRLLIILISTIFTLLSCQKKDEVISTEIAIVGGGTSGTAAAIQAARMGQEVVLINETNWFGGMLTEAGVSATDGNHQLPSGIWGEFREHIYDYYGGPDSVFTGWVSNTQFEPSVGNDILTEMIAAETNIRVFSGWLVDSVLVEQGRLRQAWFTNEDGESLSIEASVFIEATEYGDLMAKAGAAYDIHMETYEETKEEMAPAEPHPYVQDLTYTAILKDFGKGTDKTIPKPASYDPSEFECMCKQVCANPTEDLLDCDYMLEYAKLPNEKYLINWPTNGNDYYAEILEKTYAERDSILELAKDMTRSWIYFMQTEGGYTNLGYAEDEFPTADHFPLIPYIRESRRVQGVDRLFLYDLKDPYALPERPVYKTGIAVGDYPVDHHRKKNPVPKQFHFPKIPSYTVPYGSLIPREIDGLIVAEKSISVSNIVNGTTRLQPVVLQLGQAAGAAAVLSVRENIQPREVDVRTLQNYLLDADMWLMPYMDTTPDDPAFRSIQKVGLSGIMRGKGIPVAWANETRFYPDSVVTAENLNEILDRLELENDYTGTGTIPHEDILELFWAELGEPAGANSENNTLAYFRSQDWFQDQASEIGFTGNEVLTRAQLAWLIDHTFRPFENDEVQIGFPNSKLD
ncbi:FAD-dependent oxidoreductase [Gracilimonas tropica]|uniref:FAD-dependent oxidoreductase n=1 Tax=Gracilimonas tropica TaxID=454600 RepID=UPI0003635B26|nr:FAD-dependent oxidoreductase [Gracilimonas tropica]